MKNTLENRKDNLENRKDNLESRKDKIESNKSAPSNYSPIVLKLSFKASTILESARLNQLIAQNEVAPNNKS